MLCHQQIKVFVYSVKYLRDGLAQFFFCTVIGFDLTLINRLPKQQESWERKAVKQEFNQNVLQASNVCWLLTRSKMCYIIIPRVYRRSHALIRLPATAQKHRRSSTLFKIQIRMVCLLKQLHIFLCFSYTSQDWPYH